MEDRGQSTEVFRQARATTFTFGRINVAVWHSIPIPHKCAVSTKSFPLSKNLLVVSDTHSHRWDLEPKFLCNMFSLARDRSNALRHDILARRYMPQDNSMLNQNRIGERVRS